MPKMLCTCKEILAYSEIPSEIEYKFISDVEYDKFQGKIDAEELYEQMKSFILCPNCHRIWVFWNGFQRQPVGYVQTPEDDK